MYYFFACPDQQHCACTRLVGSVVEHPPSKGKVRGSIPRQGLHPDEPVERLAILFCTQGLLHPDETVERLGTLFCTWELSLCFDRVDSHAPTVHTAAKLTQRACYYKNLRIVFFFRNGAWTHSGLRSPTVLGYVHSSAALRQVAWARGRGRGAAKSRYLFCPWISLL